MTPTKKICPVCGRRNPFNRCRARKDGLQYRCKSCERAYRLAHIEHIHAMRHARFVTNRSEEWAYSRSPKGRQINLAACARRRDRKNALARAKRREQVCPIYP